MRAGTEDEIESAFAAAGQLGAEALVIGPYNFFNTRNHQLATAALRHRMPAIFNDRAFAAAGGLVSYGGSILDQYRLIGIYAGRVLKGERPAELPVQQSRKLTWRSTSKPLRHSISNTTDAARPRRRGDRIIVAAVRAREAARRPDRPSSRS